MNRLLMKAHYNEELQTAVRPFYGLRLYRGPTLPTSPPSFSLFFFSLSSNSVFSSTSLQLKLEWINVCVGESKVVLLGGEKTKTKTKKELGSVRES